MYSPQAHVIPTEDWIDHEVSEDCVCGPIPQLAKTKNGGDGWVIVHHALDERGKGKKSG